MITIAYDQVNSRIRLIRARSVMVENVNEVPVTMSMERLRNTIVD